MRYIAIREDRSKEIVGIVELPNGKYVRRVFREPDVVPLGSEEISEAQYTTYQTFELAPIYSWVPVKDQGHQGRQQADIYDPEFFFTDDEDIYKRDLPTEHPQRLVKG